MYEFHIPFRGRRAKKMNLQFEHRQYPHSDIPILISICPKDKLLVDSCDEAK